VASSPAFRGRGGRRGAEGSWRRPRIHRVATFSDRGGHRRRNPRGGRGQHNGGLIGTKRGRHAPTPSTWARCSVSDGRLAYSVEPPYAAFSPREEFYRERAIPAALPWCLVASSISLPPRSRKCSSCSRSTRGRKDTRRRDEPRPADEAEASLSRVRHRHQPHKVAGVHQGEHRREALLIGPLATHHDLESSPLVRKRLPLLSETAGSIGDPQVRNLGR